MSVRASWHAHVAGAHLGSFFFHVVSISGNTMLRCSARCKERAMNFSFLLKEVWCCLLQICSVCNLFQVLSSVRLASCTRGWMTKSIPTFSCHFVSYTYTDTVAHSVNLARTASLGATVSIYRFTTRRGHRAWIYWSLPGKQAASSEPETSCVASSCA